MQPKDEDEFVRHALDDGQLPFRADRHPLSARRRHRRQPKAQPNILEIGKAEVRATRPRKSPSSAWAACAKWPEAAAECWKRRASPPRSSTRAGSSRSMPARSNSSRAGGSRLHHRRPRPAQWFRLRRHRALNEQRINTPVVRIGWPDQFIEHGGVEILRKKHGSPPRRRWRNPAALPARKGIQRSKTGWR